MRACVPSCCLGGSGVIATMVPDLTDKQCVCDLDVCGVDGQGRWCVPPGPNDECAGPTCAFHACMRSLFRSFGSYLCAGLCTTTSPTDTHSEPTATQQARFFFPLPLIPAGNILHCPPSLFPIAVHACMCACHRCRTYNNAHSSAR